MKQPLTNSPYLTIYQRFVEAAVAHARKHTEKKAEQVLRDVAEGDKLFRPYYASFKKSEIDELVTMIIVRKAKIR